MEDVGRLFLGSAAIAVDLVATPEVGLGWHSPSVLAEYDVGALAAHTGRALVTVETYLAAPPPTGSERVVDAAGYYAAALADHDPVDSDFHRAVRARSAAAAATGHAQLTDELRAALARLHEADLDPSWLVGVLDGIVVPLGEYLLTRLVEVVVHADDLAASVGLPPVDQPDEVWAVLAPFLEGVSRARHGARATVLALARPERHGPLGAFG